MIASYKCTKPSNAGLFFFFLVPRREKNISFCSVAIKKETEREIKRENLEF